MAMGVSALVAIAFLAAFPVRSTGRSAVPLGGLPVACPLTRRCELPSKRPFLFPRRTAARRRCARPYCPPPRASEHGGPTAPLSCRVPRTIERRQRDGRVMRAHAPRRSELRPGGRRDEQRRQRTGPGKAAQHIQRCRIGPVQIFDRQRLRLNPRTGHQHGRQRRQLPAAQLLGC